MKKKRKNKNQDREIRSMSSLALPKMDFTVIPQFVLKGVRPDEIFKKFWSGAYRSLDLKNIARDQKVAISTNTLTIATNIGLGPESEIYTYRDRYNNIQTVLTVNHQMMQNATKENHQLPIGGICDYCRQNYKHATCGIPVKYEEEVVHHGSMPLVHYRFFVDGFFCSYNCGLAYIRHELGKSIRYRNPFYMDSEQLLFFMYNLQYPEKILKQSPDWHLLQPRGPLSAEQYYQNLYIYKRAINISFQPIKPQYFRQSC